MAVGDRAQARALRKEGPGGLRGHSAHGLFAARHPLDRLRAGKVDIRAVLADAVCEVPAGAEGAAAREAAGRARSCVSGAEGLDADPAAPALRSGSGSAYAPVGIVFDVVVGVRADAANEER